MIEEAPLSYFCAHFISSAPRQVGGCFKKLKSFFFSLLFSVLLLNMEIREKYRWMMSRLPKQLDVQSRW